MSPYLKSAAIVAILALAWAGLQIVVGVMAIEYSGSGGLGAVSFGLSELIVEFLGIVLIVWAVIFWRSRRRKRTGARR